MPIPASDRDRDYSRPASPHSIASMYGWSAAGTNTGMPGVTGLWRAFQLDSSGNLQAVISNATFSGQLEINTDVLEAINTSGTQYLAAISGTWRNITKSDNPSGYFPYTGVVTVHRAVVTSGYNPQFQSGQAAVAAIDNVNGGQLAVMSDLDQSTDSVTTYVPTATTTSNYVVSGGVAVTLLTGSLFLPNPNRIQSYVQVVGSGGPCYLKLGAGPASTGSFSILLKGATSDFGTDGGIWSDPGFWRGEVSISGGPGTRVIAWEA